MDMPALRGNWVDLVIILVAVFYLWGGWRRGFLLGILDLSGFLLSFLAALRFYSFFGELLIVNFSLPKGIANALGFLLAGIATEMLFSIILGFFLRKFYALFWLRQKKSGKHLFVSRLNRLLGFIPAVSEATIFTAFILTILVALPIQGAVKKDIVSAKIGGWLVAHTVGVEQQINIIFGEAVSETLTFLTVNPNPISDERIDLGFTQTQVKFDETAEQTMLNLLNKERIKMNLRHLSLSWELRDLARNYARDMFGRGYFSHYNPEGESPFDRMRNKGVNFTIGGENLALAPNVHLAHQGLMNSPGHRANILSSDFNEVGIGVIDGGIYGEMFVQEFTD